MAQADAPDQVTSPPLETRVQRVAPFLEVNYDIHFRENKKVSLSSLSVEAGPYHAAVRLELSYFFCENIPPVAAFHQGPIYENGRYLAPSDQIIVKDEIVRQALQGNDSNFRRVTTHEYGHAYFARHYAKEVSCIIKKKRNERQGQFSSAVDEAFAFWLVREIKPSNELNDAIAQSYKGVSDVPTLRFIYHRLKAISTEDGTLNVILRFPAIIAEELGKLPLTDDLQI